MSFNEHAQLCEAHTRTGKSCSNPAMKNDVYCYQHRTDKTLHYDRKNDNDPWRHGGPGALKLSDPEVQKIFDYVLDKIEKDFELNDSSDRMQSQMAAYYFVKWMEAVDKGEQDKAGVFDSLVRKNLHSLKATRDSREGIEVKVSTPAEWAAQLIAESKKRSEKKTG